MATVNGEGPEQFRLGSLLGRGSFGSVYSALNLKTGEHSAIKKISTVKITEMAQKQLKQEVDLLKELHHTNIVKYLGYYSTDDFFCINMELCEGGSLRSMVKKYGNFTETLAIIYVSQILQGLSYLHEQGVIHRDIKAANILTNKVGQTKLSVAPEIINLSESVAASDVWSLGCTIIELVNGEPPYRSMDPMSALFHIVQDDFPPIPPSVSVQLENFLMECFVKDHNLRTSVNKLLLNKWITGYKEMNISSNTDVNAFINKSESGLHNISTLPTHFGIYSNDGVVQRMSPVSTDNTQTGENNTKSKEAYGPDYDTDDWSVGFEIDEIASKECLAFGDGIARGLKQNIELGSPNHSEYGKTSNDDDFENDFDLSTVKNIPDKPIIESHGSSPVSFINEFEESDPFNLEYELDEKAEIKKQKNTWIGSTIQKFLSSLETDNLGTLRNTCSELINFFRSGPTQKKYLITQHCILPIVEKLESSRDNTDTLLTLLDFLNNTSSDHGELQENLCLFGIIPIALSYTKKDFKYELRLAAALFIRNLCNEKHTLIAQMFMASGGLNVLASYFGEEYPVADLSCIATDAINSLTCLQCSAPRSIISSVLSKNGIILRMIRAFYHMVFNSAQYKLVEEYTIKIINLLLIFSQSGAEVTRYFVETNEPMEKLIRVALVLDTAPLLKLLKCIKNVSMNPDAVETLHESGITKLIGVILTRDNLGFCKKDIQNNMLNIAFNALRINKEKLDYFVHSDQLQVLLPFVYSKSPVRQFAILILCEAAYVGKYARQIIHKQGVLKAYVEILDHSNFQAIAFDSILCWFSNGSEQVIVEREILNHSTLEKILKLLQLKNYADIISIMNNIKALIMASPAFCNMIASYRTQMISSIIKILRNYNPQVRLSALRLLDSLVKALPYTINDLEEIERLEDIVKLSSQEDVGILIREVSRKLGCTLIEKKVAAVR